MTPEETLKQERQEIARLLRAEASEHALAAADLRATYHHTEIADEAWANESDAALLNRWADLILARTPTVAVPEAPEIVF